MQQVSTKKFSEMCGCSDANIRNLISNGRLKATKDNSGNNLIDIEDPKNREYLDSKRKSAKQDTQQVAQQNEPTAQSEQLPEQPLAQDTFLVITQRIEQLAKLAGKAEQLEANIIEGKQDAEHWRNLYFQSQHDNETLRKEKETLFEKNVILEAENDRLRRHWWNFGKKKD